MGNQIKICEIKGHKNTIQWDNKTAYSKCNDCGKIIEKIDL